MVKLLDRVKMTVTGTPGTGNITLNAAEAGFQTFAQAGAVDTNVVRYAVTDGTGFEIGTAVLSSSATVMARTVEQSSNSNNALNLTSSAVVFATLSAADLSGNAAPIWTTTPPSSLELDTDGSTAVTLTGVAIDEFPVHYSWDGYSGTTVYNDSNLPAQLASAPTFSGGTASLIGSSTQSNAGQFNFRMKASDGVKTATAITAVNLSFVNWNDNISAVYDAKNYTSASGSLADQSGQSGPAMGINSSVSLVAASSGIGGVKEFSFTNASAFSYTGSGLTSSTTVALILRVPQGASGYIDSGGTYLVRWIENQSGTSYTLFTNSTSTSAVLRSGVTTSTTKVYLDGDDITNITRAQWYARLSGTSTLAGQYHSLIVTDLDLSTGFDLASSIYYPTGHMRALAFYDTAPSTDQIRLIHANFKNDYSSNAHMAAHV